MYERNVVQMTFFQNFFYNSNFSNYYDFYYKSVKRHICIKYASKIIIFLYLKYNCENYLKHFT